MFVEQQVTNQVADMGLLTETAEPAKKILSVETIDVVMESAGAPWRRFGVPNRPDRIPPPPLSSVTGCGICLIRYGTDWTIAFSNKYVIKRMLPNNPRTA